MKIINDDVKLNYYIEELQISQKFDISNVKFRLIEVQKGEVISSPDKMPSYLLFLISGSAEVYGISGDGRKIPTNIMKRGALLCDLDYCTGSSTLLYSQAMSNLLCVGIHMDENRHELDQNNSFLHYIISVLSQKVFLSKHMWDDSVASVEDKLMEYMKKECKDGILVGVQEVSLRLQCSVRQLERVLAKLCGEEKLVKIGKGKYKKL